MGKEDPEDWIRAVIRDFIMISPENTLKNEANDKAFDEVLVGFSRGDDPLYEAYKEHVGPFHWTPLEIFNQAFPGVDVGPGDLTVIAWVLPLSAITRADNRKETFYPSERWARGRIFGEEVNVKLRKHVVSSLMERGVEAVAPSLSPKWERTKSERFVFASTWSERHAAHASGLGTFGLCDGLITPVGKAMRVGSVVAHIKIPPTPRPYKDHRAYCLFFTQGICGKCIPRCPAGALSESGHDKLKCRHHVRPVSEEYVRAHYGFEGYGCGLCQTGVPCESKIPTKRDVEGGGAFISRR
ncbi:MAG: epoxyqueuosine reductase [Proteobacteria bacterium]|nr:epoxyqueuosine reductase [Pseudomonadota bacterium]